jgi:pimeloyl-ACP methyl ester carboxylesterase
MDRLTQWLFAQLGAMVLVAIHALSGQVEDTRTRMADVLRYAGVVNPAPTDLDRMVELWNRAQQSGLTREERRIAFREMLVLFSKLRGRDVTSRPQLLDGTSQFAMSIFDGGGRMDLTLPEPRGKPVGPYLHLETRGHGPTPLLLISDMGVDGRKLYASFAKRQGAAYTMYIVTLPHAGAARPLPWPETLDYAARPWLGQLERELLELVDQPRMKGVTVVGTSGGGYLAARLALLRPKQIRGVVLVNALVKTSMRALDNPDAPASFEQRLSSLKSITPAPQLFPVAPMPAADQMRRLIADPKSTHPSVRDWMAFAVKDASTSQTWTFEALSSGFFLSSQEYQWELVSTDLTEQMKGLAVPMLALGSWHDERSPLSSFPAIAQWEEMKLLYPTIPLTVTAFDQTRHYISADAPEAFDRTLADFLAGRPVRPVIGDDQPRTSPRVSVAQSIGANVRIAYGPIAVNGRNIWGEVVPNGRVWRAGTNEATTFTIDREVRIDGHALPAGTYTFFVIPNEADWTLIFNRVPRQWGASDYNPAFDALRIVSKPTESPHEETLRYAIDPIGENVAAVTLAWERRAVSFRVEALKVASRN